MRVVTYPETSGCGYYRLRQPVAALQRQGFDVADLMGHTIPGVYNRFHALDHVAVEADVVVLQRPMSRDIVEAIPIIQRQGIAVVVEIDDDFHALPKGHPTRRDSAPIHSPDRNRRLLLHATNIADLVTVSTPALAERYGKHGRVRVLRNLIPSHFLEIESRRSGMFLGWTGSTRTHVDDLRVCGDAVPRVLDESHWIWRTVGTGKGVAAQLGLGDRPSDSTGWVDLPAYPEAYARLDIAIAPLQANPFNEAKSWLKVLEAAALGVPAVGSPTSEYRRAYDLGLCLLADTPAEWEKTLKALTGSAELRQDVAGLARAAASGLTYDLHCHQWWEAWEQAVTYHRQRRNAA